MKQITNQRNHRISPYVPRPGIGWYGYFRDGPARCMRKRACQSPGKWVAEYEFDGNSPRPLHAWEVLCDYHGALFIVAHHLEISDPPEREVT